MYTKQLDSEGSAGFQNRSHNYFPTGKYEKKPQNINININTIKLYSTMTTSGVGSSRAPMRVSSIRSAPKMEKQCKAAAARRTSSVKFNSPSAAASASQPVASDGLQSSDKRRRYMRRGSKSPSMFRLDAQQIRSITEASSATSFIADGTRTGAYQQYHHFMQRRMSVMSVLNAHMERAAIVGDSSSPSSNRKTTNCRRISLGTEA